MIIIRRIDLKKIFFLCSLFCFKQSFACYVEKGEDKNEVVFVYDSWLSGDRKVATFNKTTGAYSYECQPGGLGKPKVDTTSWTADQLARQFENLEMVYNLQQQLDRGDD